MEYAEIAKEAGILIAIFAPASAALVELVKRIIPSIGNDVAATIAGLLTIGATACGVLGLLPDYVIVVAIVIIAAYAPKVVYDVARVPKNVVDRMRMG